MHKIIFSLSFYQLWWLIVVVATYFIFGVMNKVLLSEEYGSIFDVVYYKDWKRFLKTFAGRVIIIIIICLLVEMLNENSSKHLITHLGIGIGSFLQVWPAMVNFRLFRLPFKINKNKIAYLFSCMLYVLVNIVFSYVTVHVLFPILFQNKEFYILENTGVQIIWTILMYAIPGYLQFKLAPIGKRKIEINSFQAEKEILKRQINSADDEIDIFKNEIQRLSKKHEVSYNLLRAVLILEYNYRGSNLTRFLEYIVTKYIPKFAIKRNMSLGIAQIKISTAKELLEESPTKFVHKMCNPEFSIELCSMYLKKIIDDYKEHFGEQLNKNKYDYIAEVYMGTEPYSIEINKLLYSAVLETIDSFNFTGEQLY